MSLRLTPYKGKTKYFPKTLLCSKSSDSKHDLHNLEVTNNEIGMKIERFT